MPDPKAELRLAKPGGVREKTNSQAERTGADESGALKILPAHGSAPSYFSTDDARQTTSPDDRGQTHWRTTHTSSYQKRERRRRIAFVRNASAASARTAAPHPFCRGRTWRSDFRRPLRFTGRKD